MHNKLSIKNKNLKTEIIFRKNYISKFIEGIANKNEKIFCIIDSKVKNSIKFTGQKNVKIFSIKCGEKIKTFDYYKNLSEKLIKHNVNRRSIIVAIGGGTLGDLVGFVASTVLRGLDFFLIDGGQRHTRLQWESSYTPRGYVWEAVLHICWKSHRLYRVVPIGDTQHSPEVKCVLF